MNKTLKKVLLIFMIIFVYSLFANIAFAYSYYFDGAVELIPPYKTVYYEGEFLDLTGLEIFGYCGERYSLMNEDGSISWFTTVKQKEPLEDVKVDLVGKPLTLEDKIVTVEGYYSWFCVDLFDTFEITVLPLPEYKTTIVSNNFEKGKDIENGVVEFNVNNGSDTKREVIVLLGIYDSDGKMVYVKTQPLEAKFGDNPDSFEDITIKDVPEGEYTVKILCLNDIKSLSPLALTAAANFEI